MTTVDVLIVGAGPSGLMLAGWLARHGVSFAVVDGKSGIAPESRAVAVHARTMETYDQLGIGQQALGLGRVARALSLWVHRTRQATLRLDKMGEGVSPHPYVFILSQNLNETVLLEHLKTHGGSVRWGHKLVSLRETAEGALAQVDGPDGPTEILATYVCGCDGASSAVRHALGLQFPGATYSQEFYVADVEAHGSISEGEVNICMGKDAFQLTFPMPGKNRTRLVGVMPSAYRGLHHISFQDFQAEATGPFGIEVTDTTWFSSYKVHHRVAPHFRLGRCFLVGDAAHVHSPVGGQGMNTGLMDATNLAWKLAAVVRRGAPERLLDTYTEERMPFAKRLVGTTDRAFSVITSTASWAAYVRLLVPRVVNALSHLQWLKQFMFRLVSQTSISYRRSWASRNHAPEGKVRAGDRLPWVSDDGGDGNFASLTLCDWQVHVYGEAEAALGAWRKLPVHSFPYGNAAKRAGLAESAVYLIRPDGYIGMVCQPFDRIAIDAYLADMGAVALR